MLISANTGQVISSFSDIFIVDVVVAVRLHRIKSIFPFSFLHNSLVVVAKYCHVAGNRFNALLPLNTGQVISSFSDIIIVVAVVMVHRIKSSFPSSFLRNFFGCCSKMLLCGRKQI